MPNKNIGLIFGVPADINNKYVHGSGVDTSTYSVRLAKRNRASQKRAIITTTTTTDTQILNTQIPNMLTQNQLTAHTAKAIVLTCMDFRLIDDAVLFFNTIGLNNNYDNFILAGASLGYNQTVYLAWSETFDKHIELSEQLHDITDVIVVDHMQCGAYKLFNNLASIPRETEIEMHKSNFTQFKQTINAKYPHLNVSTYLMDLDGTIVPL
jgi:hypothetical protein